MMPGMFAGAQQSGAIVPATDVDDVIAGLPGLVNWFRLAEAASTSTLVDEINSPGGNTSGFGPGWPALYPGGPTCFRSGNFSVPASSAFSSNFPAGTAPKFSMGGIVNYISLPGSGAYVPVLINHDDNSGARSYQSRINGSGAIELVRINRFSGPVEVVPSAASIITAGVTTALGIIVREPDLITGISVVEFYKDGDLFSTGAVTGANWGAPADIGQLGYFGGGVSYAEGYHSQYFYCNTDIAGSDFMDIAVLAGLA